MKKLKLNIMAIIGMMVAVGTVAFTAPKSQEENRLVTHFEFIGDTEEAAQYEDATKWQLSTQPTNCSGSGLICEVVIEDTDISTPEDLADLLSSMPNPGAVESYIESRVDSRRN